jgi:4-diphosphocytidyl-2-C-methyl-D-erythritol kinase
MGQRYPKIKNGSFVPAQAAIFLTMLSFPNAKINLGLQVLRKRKDGFHDLATVFYPAGWKDALELIVRGNIPFRLTTSGLSVNGDPESNLCYKAWKLISADYDLPALEAHLHKTIPMGAGLGGGSADGAFMLRLLNDVCQLRIPEEKLLIYAAELGSDCPFFIRNRPVYATGRGEILEEFPFVLEQYTMVILMPEIGVPTAAAFSWITPAESSSDLRETLKLPPEQWKGKLINDFEEPVSKKYPVIRQLIDYLYEKGALYAAMSGSGASVYGIYRELPEIDIPGMNYWKGPC